MGAEDASPLQHPVFQASTKMSIAQHKNIFWHRHQFDLFLLPLHPVFTKYSAIYAQELNRTYVELKSTTGMKSSPSSLN